MKRPTTRLVLTDALSKSHERFFLIAEDIEIKDVHFVYNSDIGAYHPTHGKYDVLGFSIAIKEYTFKELSSLREDSTITLRFDRDIVTEDLFNFEEHVMVFDYPATITSLLERGLIEVKPSQSWMATDERSFSIGGEEWWDVDILGTSFGAEITDRVTRLWST